jgi:hypothetical protein
MMSGRLGRWSWAEDRDAGILCADVLRMLPSHFVGLRGVCASWDSGLLDPAASDMTGWGARGGHAVSPAIDSALAGSWPASPCGYDEWYFFSHIPPFEKLHALCNWQGVSPGEAVPLSAVPSAFDLQKQLDRFEPQVVVGDGHRVFVVTQNQDLLEGFVEVCRRRRTSG